MKLIAIVLLALPLVATAQMKCPDGSYRDRCAGGQGQEFEAPGMSTYSAPESFKAPIQFNRDTSKRYREAGEATRRGETVQGPSSTSQRARAAGISRNDLVKARSRGQLLVGMARKDVDHIMGKPDDVNTYVNGNRRCNDLWYYTRERGWHTRITMCGGKLTSYGADNRQ